MRERATGAKVTKAIVREHPPAEYGILIGAEIHLDAQYFG